MKLYTVYRIRDKEYHRPIMLASELTYTRALEVFNRCDFDTLINVSYG